jgi:hypothetical protein
VRRKPRAQPERPVLKQLGWIVDALDRQTLLPEQIYQTDHTHGHKEIEAQVLKAGIYVMFGRMDVKDIGHGGVPSRSIALAIAVSAWPE